MTGTTGTISFDPSAVELVKMMLAAWSPSNDGNLLSENEQAGMRKSVVGQIKQVMAAQGVAALALARRTEDTSEDARQRYDGETVVGTESGDAVVGTESGVSGIIDAKPKRHASTNGDSGIRWTEVRGWLVGLCYTPLRDSNRASALDTYNSSRCGGGRSDPSSAHPNQSPTAAAGETRGETPPPGDDASGTKAGENIVVGYSRCAASINRRKQVSRASGGSR
jgi:hypothetical protein